MATPKTGAYVEENRKLDAWICFNCVQESVATNASAPTVQLHSIRLFLAVIGRRKWIFWAMGVSISFLRSEPLKRDTYAKLPDGVEKYDVAWKLLKPLYGMSTACSDWREAIRDFLANEWGGGCFPR